MRAKNIYQCDGNCKNCDYVNRKPTGYGIMDECATDNCPKGNYKIGVVDKLGGRHVEGYGWNPLGEFCNLCKHETCENCIKWSNRDKKLRNNIPTELKQRKQEPKKEEKKSEPIQKPKEDANDIVIQARKIMEQERLAKEGKQIVPELNDTFVEREKISDLKEMDDFDVSDFEKDTRQEIKEENEIQQQESFLYKTKNNEEIKEKDNNTLDVKIENDMKDNDEMDDDIDFGVDDDNDEMDDEPTNDDYPDISFDEDDIPAPDDYGYGDSNDDDDDDDDDDDKEESMWERIKEHYSYNNRYNNRDEDDEDENDDDDDDEIENESENQKNNYDNEDNDNDDDYDDEDDDDDFDEDDDSEFDLYEQTKRLKASILFAEGTKIAKYQVRNKGVYLTTVGDAKVTVKGRNDTDGFSYCDAKKFPRYVREGILNGELYRNENIRITDNTTFCFIYFEDIDGDLVERDRKSYKMSIENASEDKIRRLLCKAFNDFENK